MLHKDSSKLKTKTVQAWKNGIMISAMVELENAKQMVNKGDWFVINSQAINYKNT